MSIHFTNNLAAFGKLEPIPYEPNQSSLGNARIGYHNILDNGSVTNPDSQPLLNDNTWQRWRPTSDDVTTIYATSPQMIDYIAIGAGVYSGVPLVVEVGSLGAFRQVYNGIPSDNKPIMILLAEAELADAIRISCDAAIELGVVFAGMVLEMQRPLFGGHSPVRLAAQTEFNNSVSDNGQWLGRTITRRGLQSSYDWQLLTDTWVREKFMPFVEHAKTRPFFMAWRPDLYPDEVVYCWCNEDIAPTNRGGGTRFMNVSFSITGHDDR